MNMNIEKIKHLEFAQLHLHSKFSASDGIVKIDDLIDKTLKEDLKAISLTDHGVVSGWIELRQKCFKKKIKPIFGVEAYVHYKRDKLFEVLNLINCPKKHKADSSCKTCKFHKKQKTEDLFGESEAKMECLVTKEKLKELKEKLKIIKKTNHLLLLAKNRTGFYNVLKIVNDSYEHFYYSPLSSFEKLKQNKEGVIVTTACMGSQIAKEIKKDYEQGKTLIKQYMGVFDDFYVELVVIDYDKQKTVNKLLLKAAKELGAKIIFTKDCHYLAEEDCKTHNMFLTMKNPNWKFEATGLNFCSQKELLNEILEKHEYVSEEDIVSGFENIDEIVNMIELFDIDKSVKIPHIPDCKKKLVEIAVSKFKKLGLQNDKEYVSRLKHEIEVIAELDLFDYFYIVWDYCNFCAMNDIEKGPRGSGAGSLFLYLLDITNPIDPIKYNLSFDRFLNVKRIKKNICLEI